MPHYIIDGFNLGFKIPHIASAIKKGNTDMAIKQICSFIKSKTKNNKVIAVFDGKKYSDTIPSMLNGISIRFSHKPETADDVIRSFVRQSTDVEQWCVVSSDNEILFSAQDLGAQYMKSDQFIRLTNKKGVTVHKKESEKHHPNEVDVDYWKQLFNDGIDE